MRLNEAKKLYEQEKTDDLLDLRNLPGGFEQVVADITNFIHHKPFDVDGKGVLGLSGGVDSALTAALAIRAFGAENVYAFVLPSATTTHEETKDAIAQAKKLGIKYSVIDIQGIVDAYKAAGVSDKPWGEGKPSTLGNAKPRMRMTLLYAWANENGGLVIGTDNKTEGTDFGMGYFTKYGDGGVDINPIGGLYKTQVWQLAKHIGVLQSIIDRKPTAGLFLGQTDEGELGIAYKTLDKVLLGFELEMPYETIVKVAGVPETKVKEVWAYRMKNQHKGAVPPSVTVASYEK